MITSMPSKMITFRVLSFMLSFGVIIYIMLSFNVIIFDVIIWCYHLMLSFLTVCKWYYFCVIIFPCTAWVLSFNVIIFCYHFLPFFFFLKTWHTRNKKHFLRNATCFLLRWSSAGQASTFPLTEWTPSSPYAASISQRSGSSRRKINESRLCLVFFSKNYTRTCRKFKYKN